MYPERRKAKYKPTASRILFAGEGSEEIERIKCEDRVWRVINKSRIFFYLFLHKLVDCHLTFHFGLVHLLSMLIVYYTVYNI